MPAKFNFFGLCSVKIIVDMEARKESVVKKIGLLTWMVFLCLFAILAACCASQKGKVEIGKPTSIKIVHSPEAYEHFVNGDLYRYAGDYQRAAEEFEKALSYDPESYEIRFVLAQTYYSLGNYASARKEAEKLTIKTLDRELLLADCARALNDLPEAQKRYQSALNMDSTNTFTWWYLARISEWLGDSVTALSAQEKICQLSFSYPNYLKWVQMLWGMGKNAEASSRAAEFLSRDSSDFRGYILLGESLEREERFTEAVEVYRQVLKTDTTLSEIKIHLGVLYFELKEYPRAESLFTSLAKDSSDYASVFYLAQIAYAQKDYAHALELFDRLSHVADTLADGFAGMAFTYLAMQKPDSAVVLTRRGLTRFSQNPSLRFWLGQAFSSKKQFDSSAAAFAGLVSEYPEEIRYLYSYAASLERSGNFDSAQVIFKKILLLEPDDAPTLNYLGYTWADRNENLAEAESMIAKALQKDPDNGAYLDSYGWVLYRRGKLGEAEMQIKKALEKNGQDATIIEHLGDIYRAQGKEAQARAQYQKALEIDPANQTLKEKLSR